MHRATHDQNVLAFFDVIGSYFVDVIYNGHYTVAYNIVSANNANNITEAYRATISQYMEGMSTKPELFKRVVTHLHKYYQRHTGFNSMTLAEFQDKTLKCFIPGIYYADFKNAQKDSTMRDIIVQVVKDIVLHASTPRVMCMIIDDHMNPNNIVGLQDFTMGRLVLRREEFFSKFANVIAAKNIPVDMAAHEALKAAFIEEKKRAVGLESDKEKMTNVIRGLIVRLTAAENEIKRMTALTENKKARDEALWAPKPRDETPWLARPSEPAPVVAKQPEVVVVPATKQPEIVVPSEVTPVATEEHKILAEASESLSDMLVSDRIALLNDDPWE